MVSLDVIEKALTKKLIESPFNFPQLPYHTLTVRQLAAKSSVHLNEIVLLIEQDKGLSHHLEKLADSPLYRQPVPPYDLKGAIVRIGIKATSNVILTYVLKNLFPCHSYLARKYQGEIWQQSLVFAALSSILAKHVGSIDTDRALLSALLQDVGSLFLVTQLDDYPDCISSPQNVRAICNQLNRVVGSKLINTWQLPNAFSNVIKTKDLWTFSVSEKYNLIDHSLIARFLFLYQNPRTKPTTELSSLPSFLKSPFQYWRHADAMRIYAMLYEETLQLVDMLGGNAKGILIPPPRSVLGK
ncbi:HDOD domain-containing protein [Zooshikella ganghwensis]|uniref:HDOD domain-containing protein n=1 Tax=Zooshikella ganghwensis TaxID=202772 RepID=UPI0003FC0402|nr:HDOD domain-containing protein [Zooshikella ganghwensis]